VFDDRRVVAPEHNRPTPSAPPHKRARKAGTIHNREDERQFGTRLDSHPRPFSGGPDTRALAGKIVTVSARLDSLFEEPSIVSMT
jgi:hypothetical protein